MKLINVNLKGFRSLEDIELDIEPLTVLIGENDSGKSSVLDLLDIFLNNRQPDQDDFRRNAEGEIADQIEVVLTFVLEAEDEEAKEFTLDTQLVVRKLFMIEGPSEFHYWGEKPVDDRLTMGINNMSAQEQRDLILEIDPSVESEDISNESKRIDWFEDYKDRAEKTESWIEAPRQLSDILPRFERYSAMDYNDPANIVSKTLRQIYEQTIYEEPEDEIERSARRLITPLLNLKEEASSNIQAKVTELESYIKKYNAGIRRISYDPVFDFEGSLRPGEFLLDSGFGLHALSRIGDGTKRRMFMAVTDWDREVTLEQSKSGASLPLIIRGYDEPDTNLHYDAQRLMFHSISDITNIEDSRIQAILCTHSLTMIDRAPAQIIRLFSLDNKGRTSTDQLKTDGDPEIESFLKNLARELGITNSIMFYERCFILIEGDTEYNALPILYRRLYKRSLVEDCIRVINVRRNSAVREFLKLMGRNRKELLIVFVDRDSENNKTANLTRKSLKEMGYDNEFINERFIFIGSKEFEDAFPNEAIVRALQSNWLKANGSDWQAEEIEQIREENKLSKELERIVWDHTTENYPKWSKPIFGRVLAETCELSEIPQEITDLFTLAQQISGITK